MSPEEVPDYIQTYIDKFEFVEAKKYLALKGPLRLNIVHDKMYPLLKFNGEIILRKPPKGITAGSLACYWYNDQVFPCLIKQIFPNRDFKVLFLNDENPSRLFNEKSYLGEIIYPKLSVYWKARLWWLTHFR